MIMVMMEKKKSFDFVKFSEFERKKKPGEMRFNIILIYNSKI